jgi:RNA polymerase sigma factor (sigma-70 family)
VTISDLELLRQYGEGGSEHAFEVLVARHINLVYGAARRQVGNEYLAEEVTQAVFIILARKARSLSSRTILPGWLCRTTGFVVAETLRRERRRQLREQEAFMNSSVNESPTDSAWLEMLPLLDDAVGRLRGVDRDALVLRYFQNKSLKEVGETLGLRERAAQKRISRGLERLRALFLQQGVTLSTAAIAEAIPGRSIPAAPAGLAHSAIAAANGSGLITSSLMLADETLKLIAWGKVKTAVSAAGALAVLLGGTIPAIEYMMGAKPEVTVFNSFGEGKTYDAVAAWELHGNTKQSNGQGLEYYGHAEWFVPHVSGRLSNIELALEGDGPGGLDLSITEDNYGFPGKMLDRFPNVLAPSASGNPPGTFVVNSTLHPKLRAGVKYWLCAEPVGSTTSSVWHATDRPLTNGFAYELAPRGWSPINARLMAQRLPIVSGVRKGGRNAAFSVTVKTNEKQKPSAGTNALAGI